MQDDLKSEHNVIVTHWKYSLDFTVILNEKKRKEKKK